MGIAVVCQGRCDPPMSTALDFGAALAAAKKEARLKRAASKGQPAEAVGGVVAAPLVGCGCPPGCVRYAADFLSDTEASALLRECEALDGWRSLSQRRMLSVGGTPHPDGAWAEPLPACLEGLASRVAPYLGGVRADQALLNDYDVGGGIDPHMDGPLYEPHAVILSLAPARLDFYDGGDTRVASVLLRETPAWEVFPWSRDGGRSFALEPPGGTHIEVVLTEFWTSDHLSSGCLEGWTTTIASRTTIRSKARSRS